MRAVCPQVPVERPGSLRYETSSFRKDHRPGFCPRPCGTSLCPWICLQISRRLLRFGILLLKLLPPNLLPVLPLQAKLCLQTLPNSACKFCQTLPAKGGPPKHAASRRPRESRLCRAAHTELVKPPELDFPWLNLLEPALALCQASLRWHRLLFNEKIRGLSQASYFSGTKMRQL